MLVECVGGEGDLAGGRGWLLKASGGVEGY